MWQEDGVKGNGAITSATIASKTFLNGRLPKSGLISKIQVLPINSVIGALWPETERAIIQLSELT
jgi:hypothetical protein